MRKDRCQDTYSPLRLVAGRLLAFLGAEEARREGRAAGVGGTVGGGQGPGRWSSGDGWAAAIRRRSAAAIRRYLISH